MGNLTAAGIVLPGQISHPIHDVARLETFRMSGLPDILPTIYPLHQ